MKIYPYKAGSQSAKALAEALGVKRIKHEGKHIDVDVLLNWGCSEIKRDLTYVEILNKTDAVKKASNKLQTFKALQGYVPLPQWTESPVEALEWLAKGVMVVARTKLTGHSGEGIVITDPDGDNHEIIEAPLYTKYIPKKQEYRIHVFGDNAFFVQRKARNKDIPDEQVNWQIRNHGNGFIFAHKDVDVPDVAKQSAITAVRTLGLDFGAVDVVYNQKEDIYYVLEVNTACGLEGTTLEKYCEQFRQFL